MRSIFVVLSLGYSFVLSGCTVVKATADVAGAAGRLGGAVVSETAGAVGDAASSGGGSSKSKTCKDGEKGCN